MSTRQRILFVCSKNRLRSPTAEAVFKVHSCLEVKSAGVDRDAEVRISPELLEWADVVFAMELGHSSIVRKRLKAMKCQRRVICLYVPDIYEYMDQELQRLFIDKVTPYLTGGHAGN